MQGRPALKILSLFVAGLVLGRLVDIPAIYIYAVSLALATILIFASRTGGRQSLLVLALFALMVIGLGYVRYEISVGYFEPDHISQFADYPENLELVGHVVAYPEKKIESTHLIVAVRSIRLPDRAVQTSGRILVRVAEDFPPLRYGDELLLRGKLRAPRDQRNPGEFDYREYLQAQGIFARMSIYRLEQIQLLARGGGNWFFREVVAPAKRYLDDFISRELPQKESALLHGLLIGERGEIPYTLKDAFSKMGVIHILAVSGMHVGFVMLIFMGVAGLLRIPYRGRVIWTLFALLFYAFLTNLKPPVVRASIMGGLFLLGAALERKTDFYNLLAVAALVILLLNPLELFQPGFQLSFSAVVAIVYFFPKLQALFATYEEWGRLHPALRRPAELLLASAAAFVGTMPITMLYFGRLPNLTLFANLIIVPLIFVGIASSVAGAIFSLVWSPVGELFLETTWLCLHSTIRIVEWGSTLPFSSFDVFGFSGLHAVAYIILIILLFNLNYERSKRLLVIVILVAANWVLWQSTLRDAAQLRVTFIDVGQGDAILLAFPDGRHALIDGGMRNPYFDNGERVVAPYLRRQGIRTIDALILSHPDSDHLGGFPYILRNFQVKQVWDNGLPKETRLYQEYISLVDSLNIPRRVLTAGDIVDDFDPIKISVLHPTRRYATNGVHSANDASLSLKVSFGEIDLLLLGDIEKNGERSTNRFGSLLAGEILKVSHHGSKTSTTQSFLNWVDPQIAVISVGKFNKFGHPHPQVVQRLRDSGARILRTDRDAAIILTTDGKEIEQVYWK